jgi:hypothetical protein
MFATSLLAGQVKAATSTFGNTEVGSQSFYIANHKDAYKAQLSGLGIIQSISVYFASSRFNAKVAIYSDSSGAPGALISQSTGKYVRSTGWNTFSVTQKALAAGIYWLSVVADSSSARGRISYSGSEIRHVQKQTRAYFGSEFTSSFGSLSLKDAGSVSMYASYTSVSPSQTPTQTPIPTYTPVPTFSTTPKPTVTPTSIPSITPMPTPTQSLVNLVQNGNFENGLTPWILGISDPNAEGYMGTLTQTENPYQGTYSGQFTVTIYPQGSGYIVTSQTLQPEIGKTYTLSFYYKTTMNVYPHVFCWNGQWQLVQLFSGATCQSTSSWKQATMTIGPVPQGTTHTEIHFDVASTGTFQVDSVAATQTQPTSTPSPTPSPTTSPTPMPTVPPSPTATLMPSATPTTSPSPSTTPTASASPVPSVNLGTYSDAACTHKLSSISWGQLSLGATTTLTLYVRNEGTTAVTLSKSVANWNPTNLSSYLTLNWNYNNQAVSPSAVVAITLSLTIATNAPVTSSFGFNTTITATSI